MIRINALANYDQSTVARFTTIRDDVAVNGRPGKRTDNRPCLKFAVVRRRRLFTAAHSATGNPPPPAGHLPPEITIADICSPDYR